MVFASGGCDVNLFDNEQEQVQNALAEVKKTLQQYELDGRLKGSDKAAEQCARINGCHSLEECVSSATFVMVTPSHIIKQSCYLILEILYLCFNYNQVSCACYLSIIPHLYHQHIVNMVIKRTKHIC